MVLVCPGAAPAERREELGPEPAAVSRVFFRTRDRALALLRQRACVGGKQSVERLLVRVPVVRAHDDGGEEAVESAIVFERVGVDPRVLRQTRSKHAQRRAVRRVDLQRVRFFVQRVSHAVQRDPGAQTRRARYGGFGGETGSRVGSEQGCGEFQRLAFDAEREEVLVHPQAGRAVDHARRGRFIRGDHRARRGDASSCVALVCARRANASVRRDST
mmetsp:Transcript_13469/g.57454  ORF Transcript_13469/g.57454 Transcript_13469/m.57454 type:complete len:217 (-) Transcript_13469:168-818(-)